MTAKPHAPPGVVGHDALIMKVIRRHGWHLPSVKGSLELDDLMQAGRLGLWRASQTFDPAKGAWSTHATWQIRAAIGRLIADEGATIRLPVHIQEKRWRRGERMRIPTRSLEAPLRGTDGNVTLADTLAAAPEVEPANDAADTAARLLEAAQLDPRERSIIAARFGARECTLEEIARPQGCTRERIRQIEHRALAKLRVAARRLRIDAA